MKKFSKNIKRNIDKDVFLLYKYKNRNSYTKRKGKPTHRVNLPSFACESNLLIFILFY